MREARAQVVMHKFPDTKPGCSKYTGSGPFPNFSPSWEMPGCNGERKPHVLNLQPEGQGKLRDPVPAQPVCFAWTISSISLPTLSYSAAKQTLGAFQTRLGSIHLLGLLSPPASLQNPRSGGSCREIRTSPWSAGVPPGSISPEWHLWFRRHPRSQDPWRQLRL